VCIALCTIVAHNIAQNRPDNFPSNPPDNHHCSNDVCLRERGITGFDSSHAFRDRVYRRMPSPLSGDMILKVCAKLDAVSGISHLHNIQLLQAQPPRAGSGAVSR